MADNAESKSFETAEAEWRQRADSSPTLDRSYDTLGGEKLDLLYTPTAGHDPSYMDKLGLPGQFPFTRGVYPNMYRGRLWTMRQFAGFGSAADTNERYKYLLERGQTGLSVAFDMPTLMGYDSDHELSRGEVGKCGVAISCLDDMVRLFEGIPLDKVSVSMTINGPAAIIFAFFIAAAEKQGVPLSKLRGTLQNDILKEYQAQKEYIFPPGPSLDLVVDTMEYCAKHIPQWHAVSVSGYHIREAGSTAAQELAFTLANGFAYVEAALERGLDIDSFAPRLSFFWNSHSDFFEELCKFRASRRIYAKRMKNKYGAKNPRSQMLRFHTQTAGCSLTAQQPENNIVRTAFQALAAVLGGTQSLHTNSLDETLALPTEKAVKIALRTQQIIAEETGVTNVIDPLGGSYFVEALTDQMEQKALNYFEQIEAQGGVVAAIENGWFMKEIGDASYQLHKEYESGQRATVGIHKYVEDSDDRPELLIIDESTEAEQRTRLAKVREERDNQVHEAALQRITECAKNKENLMPALVDAAKANATLGEICDALKLVHGTWEEVAAF